MSEEGCMVREPWELSFPAEPREVAALRRVLRLHMKFWGLSRQSEAVQLCVSEFVSLVIRHVGAGTPTSLRLSMNGIHVRIEVKYPGDRMSPPSGASSPDVEAAMGLALVGGVAERWGALTRSDHNGMWCEIATDLTTPHGHSGGTRVTRAESMLSLYGVVSSPRVVNASRLAATVAKEAVVEVIADLLYWVDAHGHDADDVLDAAQARFDVGL
ncbi:ATP-binding protein [Streptomyces sp. NPDC013012]|uniref:ATP-binding protein n=1 Tax=Streptomyces sp. NPDC013012 TaxID=3364860 RepID=UPI00367676E6